MQSFADLLIDLGDLLDTELNPDLNQVCCLVVNDDMNVQLEMSVTGEEILIATLIVELPPGRFREEILRDALKANYKSDVNQGILSYVGKENSLLLFQNVPSYRIAAQELLDFIHLFYERAKGWKDAINSGQTHPMDTNEVPQSKENTRPPMFGFQ